MSATASSSFPDEPALPQPGPRSGVDRPALDRRRAATATAGLAMLAGLALAVAPGSPHGVASVVTAVGAAAALVLLVPVGLRALRRHPGVGLLLGIAIVWLGGWAIGVVIAADAAGPGPFDQVYSYASVYTGDGLSALGVPWPLNRFAVIPAGLALAAALGGVVLLADAARTGFGVDVTPRGPWRLMTSPPTRRARITGSAIGGVGLVLVAATVAAGVLERLVSGRVMLETFVLLAVVAGTVVALASPLLVGMLTRANRDRAATAREEERQRFAAHLHDSVLQTLALVQRQAGDPAAVARLARRQEHALRAWMAGESDLLSETLVAAIREVVAGVEDEHAVTIECTAIGDRPLEGRGEALVAAAREALRNAARHAPGAAIVVFAEISDERAEVFIRDQGPGFDPGTVAPERRGIRDAIVGRMAAAGGRASIESSPGEGTEVALTIEGRGPR